MQRYSKHTYGGKQCYRIWSTSLYIELRLSRYSNNNKNTRNDLLWLSRDVKDTEHLQSLLLEKVDPLFFEALCLGEYLYKEQEWGRWPYESHISILLLINSPLLPQVTLRWVLMWKQFGPWSSLELISRIIHFLVLHSKTELLTAISLGC